uniref:baculoviral IAP repeat-containing protein 7 isoform X5 n=1 Tax=Arvicanthis niloticus TaxID=61156 RepID=UPI00148616F7|nr:baculoviral IAP repeat-containing protein 7 isoform X5 [Arvicanthis niloticus]
MFSPADFLRAAVLSMGSESRARDSFCGPELSYREDSNGHTQDQGRPHSPCNHVLRQDCLDGQILGQLRPLSEEEESSEATFLGEPAFPEMDSEDLRLASFYDWPATAGIQPEPLAAAGFFHTGQQDKVRCFFCYGGLQSWERGDDPWTEHARWFPRHRWLSNRNNGKNQKIQSLPLPQSPGAMDVQEQLRQLQEERRCKVCLDRAVSVVFVPCGHFVCTECAPNLQLCPICRVPICSCVRTFLS